MTDFPMPKDGDDWVNTIKWMIAVMDDDDPYLEFMASVLSQAIKFGGITPKQETACARNLVRIKELYEHGRLKILGWSEPTKAVNGDRIRLVSSKRGAA